MSAYFTTHHFSPHWTTPRPSSSSSSHHHQPHPPPPLPQPITTTTITAPSIAPPESSTSHRHLTLDTLAHLLHDFHLANTNSSPSGDRDPVTHRSVARPHFDLLENKTHYAIYGELAGLGRRDVGVEVNDHLFTVTISGHLRRLVPLTTTTTTTRPESGPEGEEEDWVGVVHRDAAAATATKDNDPTTQEAAGTAKGEDAAQKTEGAKGHTETERIPDDQKEVHWHVTERKVGEFRRAFQFPIESVDMSGVRASMKDGLLCVVVPKREREKREGGARKVEVD